MEPLQKSVMVLGSGRSGSGRGSSSDYRSVQAIRALKSYGYEAIMVNNNPETVSTDSDMSDALYFEPLTAEDVQEIIRKEKPEGSSPNSAGRRRSTWRASWPQPARR